MGLRVKITGKTQIYGIFGYPVKHTASPAMHNAAFEKLGLDCAYIPFEIEPAKLGEAVKAIRALNISGINVTVPHKEKIIPFLDELSREALLIGAVNTVLNKNGRLIGYNTDGAGFVASLEKSGIKIKNKRLVIFGAGGAGRAVAIQSLSSGAGEVVLADVIEEKAHELAGYINKNITGDRAKSVSIHDDALGDLIADGDIVVNASACGMKTEDPLPFNPANLKRGKVVYDLIYNPPATKLLKLAAKKGCKTFNGLGMLLHQGARAFEVWTAKKAPINVMEKALKQQIYRK